MLKIYCLKFGYWNFVFIWCLVLVIWNFNALANDSVAAIQSTYQSITDLKANFIQSTYVEVLDKNITEPGIFYMKKPGKLRIEYTGDHPKLYISDGKKLWIISPELQQIETYKVSNDSIPKEALEFLKGFGEMEKLFDITAWKPKKPIQGHDYLRLTPKNAAAVYKWLDCEFGSDHILKTMAIHNKSGNISTYVFNSIEVNGSLSNELFKK